MKKFLILIIMVASLIALRQPGLGVEPEVDSNIDGIITVGVDSHMPPYTFINENGIVKGFSIDIVRAIAIELGIDIEFYPVPSYEIEERFTNGEIDAYISSDTEDIPFIFSNRLVESQEAIFVRSTNKYIVDLDDIKNKKVAIHSENLIPEVLGHIDYENNPDVIKVVENQQQGILMLMNRDVEAYIGNRDVGHYIIQNWMQEDYIKTVGDPINKREYVFVAREEDQSLIDTFNMGLTQIKLNGTYDKIFSKWFGETIDSYREDLKDMLIVVTIIILIIIAISLFILRLNSILKKEVARRTEEIDNANKMLLLQKEQIANNNRFRKAIINSVQSGIVTIDKEQRITSINENGLAMLNTLKENIMNANITETVLQDMFNIDKHIKALNEGRSYRNQETEIVDEGNVKTYISSLYPLNDSNKGVIGAILSFEDISYEKKLSDEFKRMDKLKSLGIIVAGFAHEIRNPLTSIKALTDLIPTKIDDQRFRQDFMEIIPNQINRLDNLITDLLDYTRPRKPNMKRVRIREVIDNITALFQRNINDKEMDYRVDISGDIEVFADKQQIMQVFINLILNSLEATPAGGNINIYTQKLEDYVEIIIEDSGKGIPKDILNKIMDPFFTTKKEGTGLGLFICYQIIEKNNGFISIDSEMNKGTKVTVKLLKP